MLRAWLTLGAALGRSCNHQTPGIDRTYAAEPARERPVDAPSL